MNNIVIDIEYDAVVWLLLSFSYSFNMQSNSISVQIHCRHLTFYTTDSYSEMMNLQFCYKKEVVWRILSKYDCSCTYIFILLHRQKQEVRFNLCLMSCCFSKLLSIFKSRFVMQPLYSFLWKLTSKNATGSACVSDGLQSQFPWGCQTKPIRTYFHFLTCIVLYISRPRGLIAISTFIL